MRNQRPSSLSALLASVPGVFVLLLLVAPLQAVESEQPDAAGANEAMPAADPAADVVQLAAEDGSCVASDTVMCLQGDRYAVTIALGAKEHFDAVDAGDVPGAADWGTCDDQARELAFPCHTKVVKGGSRVIGTRDSGLFYFFDRGNWEVLIKVLDGCATPLPAHWVYAASASDQGMRITVRDTTWTAEAGAGTDRVPERVYTFDPHVRRAQMPGESDDDYAKNVQAKGHAALTKTDAFRDVCSAAASAVADAGGDIDPEGGSEAGSA